MQNLNAFVANDEGSATVWSLFWTLIFLFLAGVSIDTSNAYRFKSALQMTADASSGGAILGYLNEAKYVQYSGDTSNRTGAYRGSAIALDLATHNMSVARNGTVINAGNVTFGRWDGTSFDPTGTPVNAAQAVAQRTGSNSNALPTLLLGRFNILQSWDVGATSVTEAFFHHCPSQEGIMAGGGLQIASRNLFQGDLCLHGEDYIDLNNNNEFRANSAGEVPGLSYGPPGAVCSGFGNCQTSGYTNVTSGNINLTADMIDGPSTRMPDVDAMITDIQTVLADPAAYAGESDGRNHYIPKNLVTNPNRAQGEAAVLETVSVPAPADLPTGASASIVNGVLRIAMSKSAFQSAVQNAPTLPLPPNAIYDIQTGCASGNRRLDLDDTVTLTDIVVVTSCRVRFSDDITFQNSTLLTTYDGNNSAIHGSSGVQLGGGTCGDATNGSTLIATSADIDFAAGFQMNNSQIIAGEDVDIAAQPNGMQGTSILAAHDIRLTSNGEWQGCPFNASANPVAAYTYRIVY